MYHELEPHPQLKAYLRCIWFLERDYSRGLQVESLWAGGNPELLFHEGAPYLHPYTDEPLPPGFLIGPLTEPLPLRCRGHMRLVGARFVPWGFRPFFPVIMRELRDQVLTLTGLIGPAAHDLEARLAGAPREEQADRLQQWLLERLDQGALQEHQSVIRLVQRLLSGEESDKLQRLQQESGLSLRQLQRRFDEWIGLTPKQVGTIGRFNAAREMLRRHPDRDLADVAVQFGYYDYPHFARDFQKYFGLTPHDFRNWAARRRAASVKKDVAFLQDPPDPA